MLWMNYPTRLMGRMNAPCEQLTTRTEKLPDGSSTASPSLPARFESTNWRTFSQLISKPDRFRNIARIWGVKNPLVLSTCTALLSVVDLNNSQVLQFLHYSVSEFLTSSRFGEKCDSFAPGQKRHQTT
jgi:hypothetical protein